MYTTFGGLQPHWCNKHIANNIPSHGSKKDPAGGVETVMVPEYSISPLPAHAVFFLLKVPAQNKRAIIYAPSFNIRSYQGYDLLPGFSSFNSICGSIGS